MGLKDPITMADAMNLKSIQRKLKLPLRKFAQAQALGKDSSIDHDEKVRILLNIPDGVGTKDFLESRLTAGEMESIGKFVKLD